MTGADEPLVDSVTLITDLNPRETYVVVGRPLPATPAWRCDSCCVGDRLRSLSAPQSPRGQSGDLKRLQQIYPAAAPEILSLKKDYKARR